MSVWSSVAIIFKTSLWWGTCSSVGTWNQLLAWLQGQCRLRVPRLGAPGCGRLVVRQQLGWLVGSLLWFHEFCLSSVIYVEKVFFGCDLQAWFSDLRWGRKRWELQDCMPLLFGDLWVAQEGDRLWCQGVFCHMAAYTEVLGVPPSSLELELGASCVVPWLLSLFHKLIKVYCCLWQVSSWKLLCQLRQRAAKGDGSRFGHESGFHDEVQKGVTGLQLLYIK